MTGLKPTWGLVSRHGLFHNCESLDSVGTIGKSASDVAITLTAMAGFDKLDETTQRGAFIDYQASLSGAYGARSIRIGVDRDFIEADAEPGMLACVDSALEVFVDLGASVDDIDYPDPREAITRQRLSMLAERVPSHRDTFAARSAEYSEKLRSQIEVGLAASGSAIEEAYIERARLKGRFAGLFEKVDVILLPVFVGGTPTVDEWNAIMANDIYAWFKFTLSANMTGLPSLTFPRGTANGGRPVGVQLIGPAWSEARLLRLVHAYQQVTDWHCRRPAVSKSGAARDRPVNQIA